MSEPGRAYRTAFLLLMLTVAAVFWRHLFTSGVLFYRDISYAHFPRALELRSIVRSGTIPLWNPFEHFGESVIVNANYLLFYPTAWLTWLLPAAYGFKLHYIVHFFVLAAGSFLLARRIGLSAPACYAAGALFVFSGPVMSLGNFYNMLPATAWMPLAVLAADRLAARGGLRATAMLAGALTFQLFAGEPSTSIATAWLAFGWMLALHGDFRPRFRVRSALRLLGRFTAGLALMAGFSAVQLFPALAHLPNTRRAAQLSFDHTMYWSLQPLKLLEVLFPNFWGNLFAHWRLPWLYLDQREAFLLSLFIGVIPLALALVAVLVRVDRVTRFWLLAGFIAFLIALGRFTALSYFLHDVIPVFRVVRFPVKFLLPAALAVAQLAAVGMDWLLTATPSEAESRKLRRLGHAALGLGAVWLLLSLFTLLLPGLAMRLARQASALEFDAAYVLYLRDVLSMNHTEAVDRAALWLRDVVPGRLPYLLACVLLVAGIVLPGRWGGRGVWLVPAGLRLPAVYFAVAAAIVLLIGTHYGLNPLAPPRYFQDRPPALDRLVSAHPPARIFSEPTPSAPNFPPISLLPDPGAIDFMPSNAQVLYTQRMSLQVGPGTFGLENSMSADPELILPGPQRMLNNTVYLDGLRGPPLARLLAVGGVEYALLRRMPVRAGWGFDPVTTAPNYTSIPVRIFLVSEAVPRVYLVAASHADFLPLGSPELKRLLELDFIPGRDAVLERPQGAATPARPPATPDDERPGQARVVHRSALRVEVEAEARVPGYLVLTDSYSPDWEAEVDGHPTTLLRANHIFRAVELAPGSHRVVFQYRPRWFYYGAVVSVLSILAAVWADRRSRRAA